MLLHRCNSLTEVYYFTFEYTTNLFIDSTVGGQLGTIFISYWTDLAQKFWLLDFKGMFLRVGLNVMLKA